jgi:RNA polymerase sigma-70 factor (ECF subfamily)
VEQTFFLVIADRYKDTVYRIALNYFGNKYDAEDMVQEVFMKLYTSKKQFESHEHIRNWMIRVTINICKNTLRMPWRNRNVELDDLAESITFEQQEQSELFMSVMSLPEKHRTILYLFYYEDYSVKEISEILKLKESAVTTRLSRARNQLKLTLTEV